MLDLILNWWNFVVLGIGLCATKWCNNKYEETKSRPLLTSLPGVWTSLGLLGTFCAICWSLHGLDNIQEAVDNTGKTLGEAAKEMHGEWGDTYWYYNIFGRQYSNMVKRKGSEVQS